MLRSSSRVFLRAHEKFRTPPFCGRRPAHAPRSMTFSLQPIPAAAVRNAGRDARDRLISTRNVPGLSPTEANSAFASIDGPERFSVKGDPRTLRPERVAVAKTSSLKPSALRFGFAKRKSKAMIATPASPAFGPTERAGTRLRPWPEAAQRPVIHVDYSNREFHSGESRGLR